MFVQPDNSVKLPSGPFRVHTGKDSPQFMGKKRPVDRSTGYEPIANVVGEAFHARASQLAKKLVECQLVPPVFTPWFMVPSNFPQAE
ncbi:hypothetical protein FQN52_002306 [Onygenales sp. PD_12]|nr:hypothetical protein FQN52_002306 [Onygenales sp. PD_12]